MNDEELPREATNPRATRKDKWLAPRSVHASGTTREANGSWDGNGESQAAGQGAGFDFLPLGRAVLKQWYWIVLSALLLGVVGAYLAVRHWKPSYTATAELMRFETPNNTELYKPRQLAERTFADMIQSPELLERVANKTKNPAAAHQLLRNLVITPARESDKVAVSITAADPNQAVQMVNLYAAEAAKYTREMQSREAVEALGTLKEQLAQMDKDINELNTKIQAHARTVIKPAQQNNRLVERLQTEQEVLLGLLIKYKEIHPAVVQQRAKITELEAQIRKLDEQNAKAAPGASKPVVVADSDAESETLRTHLQALASSRVMLASREREAQSFVQNPPGYCRVFTQANAKDVTESKRAPKIAFMGIFGAAVGGGGALFLVLLLILLDPKLKTPADAKRVTGLPVVATLGNLGKMTPAAQAQWAFRTWVNLQGKLRSSRNRGFVCGITSSAPGEGRSTWVNLLSQAASDCGYRVLTIAASRGDAPAEFKPNGDHQHIEMHEDNDNRALTTSLLNTPAQVTEQLTGENPQPMVHIPLPGWVWNLERRKQWQTALNQWKNIDNVVIFIELPPATEPEAVLLAEKLPNLLWLTDSGKADASDTREQLATLRDAHCNLVGTLLNHDTSTPARKPFAKWLPLLVLSLLSGMAHSAQAQTPLPGSLPGQSEVAPVPRFQTNISFSALSPTQKAGWQKRLTLGPGDILNFTLFGQPELARTEVMVGPDGRVSYLQAQDVLAAGLTIDELRKKFDEELSKYYRAPNVIITPFAYNSKKYYVLGKVMNKGAFPLDRPITIMEAVARSQGFETGTIDNQNMVDLVDLQKSFVMRDGKRLPVNLEKLFQEGDLSQNAPLEPNDYLYFASGALKEVYVLGDVGVPGPLTWTENVTVISAITARGGYTQRAYKSKVLVIRGSLNKPQTFVVDTWATLDGRGMDFKLQPKDIIFVPHRPFIRAEELLDLAATAFIQSSVAAWAGQNIGPVFTAPVLPNL